jgi:DNA-binding NarL/FixJ family response regulator
MIRVLIADDHAVVRAGLQQLLAGFADIDVVDAASDGGSAATLAALHTPDVVLMDLQMPDVDGIEGTRRIKAATPDAAVIVLTSFADAPLINEAIDAGATGYLLKDADPDEIVRGIRAAARGESPFSPKAAQALLSSRSRRPDAGLTTRERAVLLLVADGLTNREVARRLDVSEKTVKAHLTSAYQRLGVDGRGEAAAWVRRHGLAEPA